MRERLRTADAAAFVKVGRHVKKIRDLLKELVLAGDALYVERATMQTERVVPLEEVQDDAPYFSMILVHRRGAAWR